MKRFLACLAVVAFVLMSCSAPPTEQQPPPEDASSSWRHKERCRHRSYRHSRRLCRRGPLPSTTTTTTRPPRSTTTTTTAPPRTTTTTTTTPPSTTTPDPGQGQPVGPSGNFRLAWSDEFNGSRLDTSKWRPNWLGGSDSAVTPPVNSLELSCYDPGHVRVSGGLLHLTADTNTPSGCRTRNGSAARYASGLVQTNGRYNFTYGYVEARINIPGTCSRGENWPAFWTNGQSWPRDGEIDIMEVLGGSATWHYHWGGGSAGGRGDHLSCESGWHTFGVLWEPGRLTFYYDGRQVGSHTRGVVSTRHYIILNHALSSEISPPVVVPSTLQVDWVRHWVRQ